MFIYFGLSHSILIRYKLQMQTSKAYYKNMLSLQVSPYKVPPMVMSLSPSDEVINSLLLLYWFVPVYLVLLFFNQSVSRPPNHSNCPFIAGGPFASSDINLTKPMVQRFCPSLLHSNLSSFPPYLSKFGPSFILKYTLFTLRLPQEVAHCVSANLIIQ